MATRIKSSQIADGSIVAADLHSAIAVNTTASGTFAVLYEAEKLVAASIAVIFAYLTKSVSATLVAGLITIWIM